MIDDMFNASNRIDPRLDRRLIEIFAERQGLEISQLHKSLFFSSQIFMGSGHSTNPELNFCGQEMEVIRHLLEEGFSLVSGMQQNGGMGYEFNLESQIEDEKTLERIVSNIAMALTGKEITFKERVKNENC